ncbi:MAG TPA: DUF1343 domain-containing protein, partial [Planctomycetaceae bacterium]|nr:DUF1343 domain-containing protein [Planctomycetaceae bacterium]
DHTTDPETGLPVYSLYGKTRKPTAEMLEGIDVLVFDIQDIGCRFYTYISTMGLAMEAAAEQGKEFVVLDRPNPIGGTIVEGPLLDAGKESFVGYHTIPVRHGMTIGELAKMFKAEKKLKLKLTVVPMRYWTRNRRFEATGVAWVNPSPNMRSLQAAALYPGIGLLETTNLSVGRGTKQPFTVMGAPWLDGEALTRYLDKRHPGVEIKPAEFTPTASKYKGERCSGVHFYVTDDREFRPVRLGLDIALWLRKHYPKQWQIDRLPRLLGNDRVYQMIRKGEPLGEIMEVCDEDAQSFLERRRPYLLYP